MTRRTTYDDPTDAAGQWLDVLARVYARPDLTQEQRHAILDDYRAEAIEMGDIDLAARSGESMRASEAPYPDWPEVPPVVEPEPAEDSWIMRRARELKRKRYTCKRLNHGTNTAYNWGCRCVHCVHVRNANKRAYRARRKAAA